MFETANGAASRVVETGLRDGQTTHVVQACRRFDEPTKDLWAALTDPARLPLWFAEVAGDLTPGGTFAVTGNAEGAILACQALERLALTWEFGGTTSWVTITLRAEAGGTQFTLTHETPTDPQSAAHWDTYGPGAMGVGWDWALLGLDAHLQSGRASVAAAGLAWAETDAGKAVLRKWAMNWGAAHAVSGVTADVAQNAAKRTADFYTGAADPD